MPVPIPMTNYYEILDLQPDASDEDIRVAYKKLALKWHPDRHQGDKDDAQTKFVEIKDAYLNLLEERQRNRKRKTRSSKKDPHSTPSSASVPSTAPSERSSEQQHRDVSHHKEVRSHPETHYKEKSRRPPDPPPPTTTKSSASTHSKHSSTHSSHHKHAAVSHSRSDRDDSSDEEEISPKKPWSFHKASASLEDTDYEFVDLVDLGSPLHPLRSPKHKDNVSKDWLFPLPLSLEDLYRARSHHYRITRTLRSGSTQSVKIDIKVSPSWRTGTRIRVPGVGNERKDGTFQDIVFVVEEQPHPIFTRVDNDLVINVQIPWADTRSRPYPPICHPADDGRPTPCDEEVYVKSIDGQEYALPIPRSLVEGADGSRVVGAGMPIRKHGKHTGKGDLVIKWDFIFSETEKGQRAPWHNFKRAMHWRI